MIFDLSLIFPVALWTLFILYAEIHYRIPFLPSRLYKKEPEILFDTPHRIQQGQAIPVLLLIKDAHQYPTHLVHISIIIKQNQIKIGQFQEAYSLKLIGDPLWYKMFFCVVPKGIDGIIEIEPEVTFEIEGCKHIVLVDNYPQTSHKPFQVFIDSALFPGSELFYFGDLHYHSHLTNDQVEFGAPLEIALSMAQAQGLSFFAVTDHSYDLDDQKNNYLINDSNLPKWQELKLTVQRLNVEIDDFLIIYGEELSAGNSKNRNVHLLLLNNNRFFEGYGDSAEKWLRTRPQWSVRSMLNDLEEKALAFAAHPETPLSIFQRIIFKRDRWSSDDYYHAHLTGMQIWNGKDDLAFKSGLEAWKNELLLGRKSVLIAGNDAHGDFGRSRRINIPFWSIKEDNHHLFAQMRTGILRKKTELKLEDLLMALKGGHCIVTNGPIGCITLLDDSGYLHSIGDTCSRSVYYLFIESASSSSFGPLYEIELYIGDCENKTEIAIKLQDLPLGAFKYHSKLAKISLPNHGYIRLQVTSCRTDTYYCCYTNPIFLDR